MNPPVDYRKVLMAYIRHVEREEGVTHLVALAEGDPDASVYGSPSRLMVLTEEEQAALAEVYRDTGLDC